MQPPTTPPSLVSWPAPDAALWLHPDLRDPSDATAYPVAPGGSYTLDRTYRDVLAQMNMTNLDEGGRSLAVAYEWLMSQDFVCARGDDPGVPARDGAVWMPGGKTIARMTASTSLVGHGYADPSMPSPDGIGLSYYVFSDDGRVAGWRWDDDAADHAAAEGRETWILQPRKRPVLVATVAAFAELLVGVTQAIFDSKAGDRDAETRAYQRKLVAGMATEALRARVAEGAARVPAYVRAMWVEELASRGAHVARLGA